MTRQRILAALAILTIAATVSAADLPPGKWWRQPGIVQRLGLSEDQQNRLEGIFRTNASELIDLRGNVQKQSIALRGELDQPQLNRQNIQRIAAKLSEARARLFEHELMMLVDMRAVLTEVQWNQMRNVLDNLDDARARQGNNNRPGMRPGMQNQRRP
jgi:Spy/CpxP family protein refolding chaperone